AGFDSPGCCGVGLYIGRSFMTGELEQKIPPDDAFSGAELTDVGLEATAAVWDRVRVRARAGLTGEPPRGEQLMRGGVSADASVLVRVFPWASAAPAVGKAIVQLDLVGGLQIWALVPDRTTAGPEGDATHTMALTGGVRIATDYGVDFR